MHISVLNVNYFNDNDSKGFKDLKCKPNVGESFKLGTVPETNKIPQTVASDARVELSNIAKYTFLANLIQFLKLPTRVEAVGYDAAKSTFSPNSELYITPFLPQSALLNIIPIESELIGQLQAYIESFVQLINPTSKQQLQIQRNTSVLWNNLRINAQRAAGMFIYNSAELQPQVDINDYSDLSILRRDFNVKYLLKMRQEVLQLVNASRSTNIEGCIQHMRDALTTLCLVADTLVPVNDTYPSIGPLLPELENVPRLRGRATVTLSFRRPTSTTSTATTSTTSDSTISSSDEYIPLGTVTLLVDGFNYPLTGGNFIDQCLKGNYHSQPIRNDIYEYKAQKLSRVMLGTTGQGYVEPATGKCRRIPLEVLREDEEGIRSTAVGSARNSMVFTKAIPILSFATEGAVGMYHDEMDTNSASSAFFFLLPNNTVSPTVRNQEPIISRLDNRYALFAYIVNGVDLIESFKPGDVLSSANVEAGVWDLIRPGKTPLTPPEILFSGENT
eukprot:gene7048-14342_t